MLPLSPLPPSSCQSPHLPPTLIVNHPPLRLGIIHGHQILPIGDSDLLYSLATTMDVDVLVSGSTHKFKAFESGGKFFVDPGSATGAWCSVWPVMEEEQEGEEVAGGGGEEKDTEGASESAKDGSDEAQQKKGEQSKEAKANGGTDKETQESTASKDKTSVTAPIKPAKAYPDPIPSFVLLDIQGPTIMSYVYQLINGEVKVEKIEYRKNMDAPSTTGGVAMGREASGGGYGAEMGVGGGMAGPRW